MVHTKVFVGNLSFSTAESELAKEFEVAGKVISANIITRGPRSLGYGFVEMESNESAENAVRLLNKKEIDGRQINVEVAKPREEGEEPKGGRGSDRGGRGGSRGGIRGGRGGFRGGRGGGEGRGGSEGEGGFRRRFRRRGSDDGESSPSASRGGRGGGPRPRRGSNEKREEKEDTRTPSKTTLFVANLPFSMDDDGFAKVFKDNNLAFKSAHVVKKRTGRSKGFGFAEFENESDQQKALAGINNKSVDGRELVVKVALIDQQEKAEAEAKQEEKSEEKKEEKKN